MLVPLMDDPTSFNYHDVIAENYGKTILAWLAEQPSDTERDLSIARRELGLDPIQFEMGMLWCRREGYFGLMEMLSIRPEPVVRRAGPPRPPGPPPRLRRFLEDRGEDDDSEDDEDDEDGRPFRRPPSLPPRRDRRRYDQFSTHRFEEKIFDRELKVAGLALMSSGIVTALVVEQFKSMPEADRSALAMVMFFGVAFSMFIAVLFVSIKLGPKQRE